MCVFGRGQVGDLAAQSRHTVFVCPTCHAEEKRPSKEKGKASKDQGSTTAQPQPAPPSGSSGVDTDNLGKGF